MMHPLPGHEFEPEGVLERVRTAKEERLYQKSEERSNLAYNVARAFALCQVIDVGVA